MNRFAVTFAGLLLIFILPVLAQGDYDTLRNNMVIAVQQMTADTRYYTGTDRLDTRVIDALKRVPRHEFIPVAYRQYAYENRPLPIGENQTISQPYIVGLMTHLAQVEADDVVLEIGTGSGYQAAVLGEIAGHVYTIEIIGSLGRRAQQVLSKLGYENITVRIGDGYHGWLAHAPFDAILVTAAPETVPQPLIDQLKPGGRLIIPVGSQSSAQSLRVLEKDAAGVIQERDVLPVGFVPLTRED